LYIVLKSGDSTYISEIRQISAQIKHVFVVENDDLGIFNNEIMINVQKRSKIYPTKSKNVISTIFLCYHCHMKMRFLIPVNSDTNIDYLFFFTNIL
jgi:hypothetical protein